MIPISCRFAFQYRLGEQAFPPKRNQPTRIQVTGMKAPETHPGILGLSGRLHKLKRDLYRASLGEDCRR